VAFERALEKVRSKHDTSHVQAEVVQQHFSAQSHTSSSRSKWTTNLNQTLEECQILLCL
jgi:hypothetical protein